MKLASNLYINRTQLADELGVSIATIRNWSKKTNFQNQSKILGKLQSIKP